MKQIELISLKELQNSCLAILINEYNPNNYTEDILKQAIDELSNHNLRYDKKEGCLYWDTLPNEGKYKRYPADKIPKYDLAYDIFKNEFAPHIFYVAARLKRLQENN